MKRLVLLCLLLLLWSPTCPSAQDGEEIVFALCSPRVAQIQNIEILRDQKLLPALKLLCVHHRDELTDYGPSREYAEKNALSWVRFAEIAGAVRVESIFGKNAWTEQFREIFRSTGGIVFTGGSDIPPRIYGEEASLLTIADTPLRSVCETSFLFHLIGGDRNLGFAPFLEERPSYVVLGICLGCQTMNVAAGGTLHQDIPSEVYGLRTFEDVLRLSADRIHNSAYLRGMNPEQKDLAPAFHRIRLLPGTMLARMGANVQEHPQVLTSHHQCIEKLGHGLEVAATSMDGKVIEAVVHAKYPKVLGVQFHPEYRSLFQEDALFRKAPDAELDFNPRAFLETPPCSFEFHRGLWAWFARSVRDAGKNE